MSAINLIISWLSTIAGYLYDAYLQVRTWIYPFNLLSTPLYYLYSGFSTLSLQFYYFGFWVQDATTKLSRILSYDQIFSYFQTWFTYAYSAWFWVQYAWSNITPVITSWWNEKQQEVKVWIENAKQWALVQISNLVGALAEVQAWWNSFKANLPTLNEIILWWKDWWARIESNLHFWWLQRLFDIEALFNTWATELAPLWEGWQEKRDEVFDFFDDPLTWLIMHLEDWFWGKEEV